MLVASREDWTLGMGGPQPLGDAGGEGAHRQKGRRDERFGARGGT